jgi:seryl-tRNA synthetase
MIDIKEIRKDRDKYKKAARDKGFFEVDIDQLLKLYDDLLDHKKKLQDITTEKNRLGKTIRELAPEKKQSVLFELTKLKQNEGDIAVRVKLLERDFNELLLYVAQPTDDDVPVGKDETENVEIRKEGKVRQFDFEPKDHVQLGKALDIIDIERGVKLAGTRNYILKGDGALLHWAVLRFAMDFMVGKGYVPMSVPVLMRYDVMRGTGFFPGSEDQTYRTEEYQTEVGQPEFVATTTAVVDIIAKGIDFLPRPEDQKGLDEAKTEVFDDPSEKVNLNLAGTAEVPLTAYHMGEILSDEELPLKYVALSSCFRREAGAAGKDTYGLYRVHQFDKVEQVVICKNSIKESNKFHEEILANSEAVMKALELPYRVVNVCTGDLGRGQAKKYDIEAWMPSRKNYCETHSASKFYEFQARRMNLRYRDDKSKIENRKSKIQFCHTLNNTVIASPRILISLLELYQNADGSVTIPKVLRPYMGGKEKIVKRES